MNMNKSILAIGIILVGIFAVQSTAAQTKTRVKFSAGTHGSTVKGTIKGYAYRDYLLGAAEGQTIELKVTSTGSPSTLSLFRPDGETVMESVGNDEYTGQLEMSGDYVVRVLMMRNEARRKGSVSNYTLKISIR